MTTLFLVYSAMFFAVESARNTIRIYQVVRKQYVNPELAHNLQSISWVLVLVGFILGFTSNLLFLPTILFIRISAAMFVQHYFGENRVNSDIDELIRSNSQQLIMTRSSDIKLLGGSHAHHNRLN